jgi:hypothetical protein
MCDACTRKADSIAKLSTYFREKADETSIEYYIDIMRNAADVLSELTTYFSTRCRCDGDVTQRIPLKVPNTDLLLGVGGGDRLWVRCEAVANHLSSNGARQQ